MTIILILIKLVIFLLVMIGLPALLYKIFIKEDDNEGTKVLMPIVCVMLSFIVYFYGIMFLNDKIPTKWVESGEYKLIGLENNHYLESRLSGKVHRDFEVNRYNYMIEENGKANNYWVSYNIANIEIKKDAFYMTINRKVKDNNFVYKYILPHFIVDNYVNDNSVIYTFHVDPKYAEETLGMKTR